MSDMNAKPTQPVDPAMQAPPAHEDQADYAHLTDLLIESYRSDARIEHIAATFLPSREKADELICLLRELIFPGFFSIRQINQDNLAQQTEPLLRRTYDLMVQQIDAALRYSHNLDEHGSGDQCEMCTRHARQITQTFFEQLPELRASLALDVQATYDGDPAARHPDEAVFCYPGIYAIFAYRVAHILHEHDVPLLPRIITEHAHEKVGIDIHPGAQIGKSFFIDHGTGVVIGETTVIGEHVKIYQGVTLGALSFPKDERGRIIRGTKRHPTIEDHVTIYASATILGGNTTVGEGCIIGANVFITKSVPPGHMVTHKAPELKYRAAKPGM